MQKTKRKIFVVAVVIFSMVAMYGVVPTVKAVNMDSVSVTLGDSDPGNTATTTVTFNLGSNGATDDYIRVVFATDFSGISAGSVVCPLSGTASTTGDIVDCTGFSGALDAATDYDIQINTTNPGTKGDYDVTVSRLNSSYVEQEMTETKVYIIEQVSVTAHVNASLTFEVAPVDANTSINGATTNATSSTTTIPFGDLNIGSDTIVGQKLTVSTNASDGYTVTVQQDGELTSAAGATINSFDNNADGSGSTTPHAWNVAAGTLGSAETYGHMGITTDDGDLNGALAGGTGFAGNNYAGLNGVAPLAIMGHDGPVNGQTTGIGTTNVAYRVDITGLQEAGDYQSTLTYVCTPTY